MRSIFSLPARLGGLGIQVPMLEASFEYECSVKMTAHLAEAIYRQDSPFETDEEATLKARNEVKKMKEGRHKELKDSIKENCHEDLTRLLDLASEKGASSWLMSLPLADYGFNLNEKHFIEAISI